MLCDYLLVCHSVELYKPQMTFEHSQFPVIPVSFQLKEQNSCIARARIVL